MGRAETSGPPHGGSRKRRSARPMGSVSFDMSGVDLAALCARCNAPGFRCKHVLLKLPPNYDTDALKAALKGVADVRLETALRKMILAVVSFRRVGGDAAEED